MSRREMTHAASRAVASASRPDSGFTILEIMIATAILTLGLIGILALFPVAIHSGKQIVEKSTAVVVGESVAEAVREGIHNNLRYSDRTGDVYFIFKHDGVTDPIPTTRSKENARHDYYILLPTIDSRRTFSGRTARLKALEVGKTFLYPEDDTPPNAGGRSQRADNDANDGRPMKVGRGQVFRDVRVRKVYQMGTTFPTARESGPDVLDDQKIDALKQYSFAFSVSLSAFDANVSPAPDQFKPAGRLYHVHVMVFRGFFPPAPDADPQVPVYELDFEVAI